MDNIGIVSKVYYAGTRKLISQADKKGKDSMQIKVAEYNSRLRISFDLAALARYIGVCACWKEAQTQD